MRDLVCNETSCVIAEERVGSGEHRDVGVFPRPVANYPNNVYEACHSQEHCQYHIEDVFRDGSFRLCRTSCNQVEICPFPNHFHAHRLAQGEASKKGQGAAED